jgi:drug/metabolite transporter (DMT)-like permease
MNNNNTSSSDVLLSGILLPLLSGLFAALGSALTKYTLNWPSLYAFLSILLCNLLMWFTYTKSYSTTQQQSQPSINVMSLNFLGNILCSGLFGSLLFGEELSLKWFQGATMLLLGVLVINYY